MASHTSATVREETPHANETTRTATILKALTRRAQAILNDTSLDAQTRAIIRYGLETNDPWLAQLVKRAEAGERLSDTFDFSQRAEAGERLSDTFEFSQPPEANKFASETNEIDSTPKTYDSTQQESHKATQQESHNLTQQKSDNSTQRKICTSTQKLEALVEIICGSGDESAAALFVLMGILQDSAQPKALANTVKHSAFTRCGELNLYGMVDAQMAFFERALV